jgi:vacuolar protein sorting-associated protein 26
MYYDRGSHYEFVSLLQELAAPGEMRNNQSFDFEFKNVEKQYESYHGINIKLRYVLGMADAGISFESPCQDAWQT